VSGQDRSFARAERRSTPPARRTASRPALPAPPPRSSLPGKSGRISA